MLKSFSFYFILVLAYLQYNFWLGWGGYFDLNAMHRELVNIQNKNNAIVISNNLKKTQTQDLQDFSDGYEDLARTKLGMIKFNEILIKPKNN